MSPPPGGRKFFYGWVVLAASTAIILLVYGSRYSLSILYPVLLEEFGASRGSTALVFSLNLLFYGLTALVAGPLIDRFGPKKVVLLGILVAVLGMAATRGASQLWHLYLLLGVVVAIGTNASGYLPQTVLLSRWFIRRRGLAIGILEAGGSLAFFMGLLFQYLILSFGWQTSYLLLSILVAGLALPLAVFVLRERPEETGHEPDGAPPIALQHAPAEPVASSTSRFTLLQAMKSLRFWSLYWSFFCFWGIAYSIILAHQVAFTRDVGYSEVFAALVYGLYGGFFALGALLGFVSDVIGRERAFTLGAAGSALGIALLLVVRDTSTPWLLYLFAFSFGVGGGIATPAMIAGIADVYKEHLGSVYGFMITGFAFGGALGSWLGGKLFDVTGSYDLAFWLTLLTIVLATALFWIAAPRKAREVRESLQG